jgi:hypothetical protein
MDIFKHLFGANPKDASSLLPAIEVAVSKVEPLLKQTRGYPNAYRKPVLTALEYVHSLASRMPGPVAVNPDSYTWDAYVHAIASSRDFILEAFQASKSIQDYLHEHQTTDEAYALMGMRRREKTSMGMKLSGQVIQKEVPQQRIYFTDHTIVDPAPTEAEARERVALGFFNNLAGKVAMRVASRKQEVQAQIQELELLKAHLHTASAKTRPALEAVLSKMLGSIQATTRTLELHSYIDDFEAVLLNPEQHLYLEQSTIILDSMGIKLASAGADQGETIIFDELIGFDRRNWTVTMVHCHNLQRQTFAERLEIAYRSLTI